MHLFPFLLSKFLSLCPLTLSLLSPPVFQERGNVWNRIYPWTVIPLLSFQKWKTRGQTSSWVWVLMWVRGSSNREAGSATKGNLKGSVYHQVPADAVDILCLPQHEGSTLSMDYLFTAVPNICLLSPFWSFISFITTGKRTWFQPSASQDYCEGTSCAF